MAVVWVGLGRKGKLEDFLLYVLAEIRNKVLWDFVVGRGFEFLEFYLRKELDGFFLLYGFLDLLFRGLVSEFFLYYFEEWFFV